MVPPSTPAGLNIVRISLSAAHSDDDLSMIIASLAEQSGRLDAASRAPARLSRVALPAARR